MRAFAPRSSTEGSPGHTQSVFGRLGGVFLQQMRADARGLDAGASSWSYNDVAAGDSRIGGNR